MTPVEALLREQIQREGSIPFHRFMQCALYHPEHGYYRRSKDPFGKHGDFYTAEQIQPTFGLLSASFVRQLCLEAGIADNYSVVEPGAGRREMAEYFADCNYVPVEFGDDMPDRFQGVVFANEFFDAMPVHVVKRHGRGFHEMRVGLDGDSFSWIDGERVAGEIEQYLTDYAAPLQQGGLLEVNIDALRWLDKVSSCLEKGYVLVLDYGYLAAEVIRFPAGTLMSYQKHVALEDVLAEPGNRDITAHVCFTALEQYGSQVGLEKVRHESMGSMLLRAGEPDQFASVLAGGDEKEATRRRLQLKTLLFGMGETFLSVLLRKA